MARKNKTASKKLENDDLPRKEKSTFSVVDGSNKTVTPVPPYIEKPLLSAEQIETLTQIVKNIKIEAPVINFNPTIEIEPAPPYKPEPPVVNFTPIIEPSVVRVKPPNVQFQTPKIEVKNEMNNMKGLCWAAFLISLLLAMDFGFKVWLSQM